MTTLLKQGCLAHMIYKHFKGMNSYNNFIDTFQFIQRVYAFNEIIFNLY